MSNIREAMIAELDQRHDAIAEYVRELDLSKASAQQIHCSLLLARIVELTGGALALVQSRRSSGVPVLLRAVLEARVDLSNLYRDEGLTCLH